MTDVAGIRDDLADDRQALELIVAGLSGDPWVLPTPGEGWTVSDRRGHLACFDGVATLCSTEPDPCAGPTTGARGAGAPPGSGPGREAG